jgi:hypothetical protein
MESRENAEELRKPSSPTWDLRPASMHIGYDLGIATVNSHIHCSPLVIVGL